MGNDTYAQQRTRSGIRDSQPYSRDELAALMVPGDILTAFDELGLAVVRLDAPAPVPSRLAAIWLADEIETFAGSGTVQTLRRTTHEAAQWDYACRTGRVVRLRRYERKGRLYALLHDVTLEADHRDIMDDAAAMGTGFLHYSVATGRIRIFGDFLDTRLSPSEQLELRRTAGASVVHPRERERYAALTNDLLTGGGTLDTVLECRCRKVPSFRLHIRVRAIQAEDGTISKLIGSFRDVTAERSAQAELVRLRNEHSADAGARQFMVARIVHEVRTPLSGIVGMAEIMGAADSDPRLQSQFKIVADAARDAMRLLETLSGRSADLSGVEALNPGPTDIHALVTEAAALWEPQAAGKSTELVCRIAPAMPRWLRLDAARLRQCLTNLLSNAVKFTDSGRIELILTPHPSNEARFVIAVRDTGIGMDADEQARLFQPFVQGNAHIAGRYGGKGLGLSITNGLVARMDGRLRCQSAPGEGTLFTVELDLTPSEDPEQQNGDTAALLDRILDAPAPAQTSPLSDLHILAVDDNETNRMVVEHLLHGRVASVTLAENGQVALDKLAEQTFDAVLMDIHMPVMDGIETTIAIRAARMAWSDIPIIALTADSQYQQKRMAVNIGMDAALAKPVTLNRLLEAFESLGLHEEHARQTQAA